MIAVFLMDVAKAHARSTIAIESTYTTRICEKNVAQHVFAFVRPTGWIYTVLLQDMEADQENHSLLVDLNRWKSVSLGLSDFIGKQDEVPTLWWSACGASYTTSKYVSIDYAGHGSRKFKLKQMIDIK